MMPQSNRIIILFFGVMLLICFVLRVEANSLAIGTPAKIENAEKLRITRQLELEGKALLKQRKYVEAEQKFIAADDPKYWLHEGRPNGVARAWLRAALVMQGKYEEALKRVQDDLSIIPDHQPSLDEQLVYRALVEYRDSDDAQVIYRVIATLQSKYADRLPPNTYVGIGSLYIISTILRLYDTIQDYDAGIKYIDEVLEYGYSKNEKYVRVATSEEAREHGYSTAEEFLKVREAFEREKANGGPTCGQWGSCTETPEGKKYCVGDATQALIQSDYFPW